jgi:transcriptional regulator with GAF, ATPase, and Fis domain
MSSSNQDLWGLEETTTSKHGKDTSGRLVSLRVIMEDLVTSHSLPTSGEVCLGRGAEVHVRVSMPDVSRRHAMLRIGRTISLSDLGSANGTRLRGERLSRGTWHEITPGEWFLLGDVTVVINDGPMQSRPRRSVGESAFRGVLEALSERFRSLGRRFFLVTLRCVTTRRWVDVVEAMLMPHDNMIVLSDSEVAVLLTDRKPDAAERLKEALGEHLKRIGARAELTLLDSPVDPALTASILPERERTPPKVPKTLRPASPLVQNDAMTRLYELVDEVAASPTSILILGETGVGKEVLARAIHDRSERRPKPFLALNCAALSENLLESELFGYEKGAFTGAVAAKAGLLETAEGGTVFLDEVGDMQLSTQAKLLRVLEERKVWRLGGLKPRDINVRVLAATNRSLEQQIATGRFRADLFYRLNGLSLTIPPLRDRRDEVRPLAERFSVNAADAMGKRLPTFSLEAMEALERYAWPGNIRELRNVVERAVLLARKGVIGLEELPDELCDALAPAPTPSGSGQIRALRETLHLQGDQDDDDAPAINRITGLIRPPRPAVAESSTHDLNLTTEMEQLEKARILDALSKCHGNQTRAAEMLGITRRMLISRIERYDIPRPRARTSKR